MGLFKDVLGAGESLFRNENALDYSFVPKMIPYRESEQHHIAACIKPLFNQRSGRNLFIFGQPGVGKTAALRSVLNEMEEETDDIYPIYINCWQHNSSFKVFLEICESVGYKFTQNKRSEELLTVAKQMINKKSAVFVLDEIDKLDDNDFLYTVLEEIFRKTVIAITNERDWLAKLDTRIRSRLMADSLEFRPYNEEETRGILKQRMEVAFVPGVWDNDAFEMVAQKTFSMKDIRRGLFLMRESAILAEAKASKKITREFVEKAVEKLDDFSIKDQSEMDEDDKLILEIIRKNSGKKIGEIYKSYQEAGGKAAYKTFQRRMDKFEKDRLVTLTKISGGSEGSTTLITYSADKKLTEF